MLFSKQLHLQTKPNTFLKNLDCRIWKYNFVIVWDDEGRFIVLFITDIDTK